MTTLVFINSMVGVDFTPIKSTGLLLPFTGTQDLSQKCDAYVQMNIQNIDLKLFLNHDKKIPYGSFYYDYFNSGQIYVKLDGQTIYGVTDKFHKMIANLFFGEKPILNPYPTEFNDIEPGDISNTHTIDTAYGKVYIYRREETAPIGYLFSADTYFYSFDSENPPAMLSTNETQVPFNDGTDIIDKIAPLIKPSSLNQWLNLAKKVKEMNVISEEQYEKFINADVMFEKIPFDPYIGNTPFGLNESNVRIIKKELVDDSDTETHIQCHYYSSMGPVNDVVSPEYKFANHVPGFPSCSNPLISSNDSLHVCPYSVNRSRACSLFKPREEIATAVTITPQNSSHSIQFSMKKQLAENNSVVYVICNDTDENVLATFSVPQNISDEDSMQHANSIFDEYVSCYTEHTKSPTEEDVTEIPVHNKYISTLIEA